jgi:hypothetical protein
MKNALLDTLAKYFLTDPFAMNWRELVRGQYEGFTDNQIELLSHGLKTPALGCDRIVNLSAQKIDTITNSEIPSSRHIKKFNNPGEVSYTLSPINRSTVVIGTHGMAIYDNKDRYVDGLCAGDGILYAHSNLKERLTEQHITGRAIVLCHAWSNGYFHWILEVIPRLILMEEAGFPIKSMDKIFVRRKDETCIDTLVQFGVSAEKIIELNQVSRLKIDELIAINSLEKYDYSFTPTSIPVEAWIPESIGRVFHVGKKATKNGTKYFIDRSNDRIRRVTNMHEVDRVLSRHNIKKINLSEFSLHQKIGLLRSATLLAGPAGAGFANLVFAPNSIKSIIAYQSGFQSNSFETICRPKEIQHTPILCRGLKDNSTSYSTINDDITICEIELDRALTATV